jgi:hypothetical protein
MVIQDDAWQVILKRRLAAGDIHEIAAQGLGVPEARWRYQERGVSLSDVRFFLELRTRNLTTPQRMEAWKARRELYGLPVFGGGGIDAVEHARADQGITEATARVM